MNGHAPSKGLLAATIVAALLLLERPTAVAEEHAASNKIPAHCVVLRLSDQMLNSILGQNNVDRQINVCDNILGTSVSGKLRLVGKPSVTFVDSPTRGVLNLRFDGTTYSRTTGYNGPAILHNRAITTFSATRQIVLEPGKGIYGLPPEVTAHTHVYLDGIDSTRGGLIGRIVRRRATRIEASRHDEATEIVRQKSERRIEAGFMRHSQQRLAQLNSLANHRAIAAVSPCGMKDDAPKLSFSTTPHCLQITATFGTGNAAHDLPPVEARTMAPVELWIHHSLLSDLNKATAAGPVHPQAIRTWLETLSRSIPLLAKVDSEKLAALFAEKQFQIRQLNDWQVLALENRTDRSSPVAPPTPRVAAEFVPPSVSGGQRVPAPTRPRIWTSGTFTAHAEFLELLDGNIVRLRRVNGIVTRIPLEKLSAPDQHWIASYLGSR